MINYLIRRGFTKDSFGKKTDDEIVQSWKELGVLKGLRPDKVLPCAKSYERMAEYLVKERPDTSAPYIDNVDCCLIPMVRRTVCGSGYNDKVYELVDPRAFVDFILDFVKKNGDHYLKAREKGGVFDMEAQLTADCTDRARRIIESGNPD